MNKTFNSLRLDAGIARTHVGSTLVVLNPNGEVEDPLVGLDRFARLIIQECIKTLKEAADDIDNGDIFRDQELLNKFEEKMERRTSLRYRKNRRKV